MFRGSGLRVFKLGFRDSGLNKNEGLGFGIQGLGCGGLGSSVWGFRGLRVEGVRGSH